MATPDFSTSTQAIMQDTPTQTNPMPNLTPNPTPDSTPKGKSLSDKIWWTRKARFQTERRLLSYDLHSQLILIWYSLSTACVSVYFLKQPTQSDGVQVSMTCLSILTLCASLFVANRQFKHRANLIKSCYEQLETLLGRANRETGTDKIEWVTREYTNTLMTCENHQEIDYQMAKAKLWLSSQPDKIDKSSMPTWKEWICISLHVVIYTTLLVLLYALPVVSIWWGMLP